MATVVLSKIKGCCKILRRGNWLQTSRQRQFIAIGMHIAMNTSWESRPNDEPGQREVTWLTLLCFLKSGMFSKNHFLLWFFLKLITKYPIMWRLVGLYNTGRFVLNLRYSSKVTEFVYLSKETVVWELSVTVFNDWLLADLSFLANELENVCSHVIC